MTHRDAGPVYRYAVLTLPALVLLAFPPELMRVIVWAWIAAVTLLLLVLMAALLVRSLILPLIDPQLYRLVSRPRLRGGSQNRSHSDAVVVPKEPTSGLPLTRPLPAGDRARNAIPRISYGRFAGKRGGR